MYFCDMETDISIDTLLPLGDFMTIEQLERYGYYFIGELPDEPFTWEELRELQVIKRTSEPIKTGQTFG